MRLAAYHLHRMGPGEHRLTLEGVYCGEVCQVVMSTQEARELAKALFDATQEAAAPCRRCGSGRVDPLLPNAWAEKWECLRCGWRW